MGLSWGNWGLFHIHFVGGSFAKPKLSIYQYKQHSSAEITRFHQLKSIQI